MTLAWEQPSPWSGALQCVAVTFSRNLSLMHINERGHFGFEFHENVAADTFCKSRQIRLNSRKCPIMQLKMICLTVGFCEHVGDGGWEEGAQYGQQDSRET